MAQKSWKLFIGEGGGWVGVGGHGHVDRDERSQLQRVVHLGTSFHKNITQELADRHTAFG
jgi:hypothetical protein